MTETMSTDLAAIETPYVCPEPGCYAAYKHPQHLGLHKYHKHGIQGQKAIKKAKKPLTDTPRKYTPRPRLSANDVCMTVLKEVAPNARIPLEAINAYNEWVAATKIFLDVLSGKAQ